MLDKQGHMHARACTRPRARVPTRTYARTRRQIFKTYFFSTTTLIRERASTLRYAHIARLVCLNLRNPASLWTVYKSSFLFCVSRSQLEVIDVFRGFLQYRQTTDFLQIFPTPKNQLVSSVAFMSR